MKKRYPIGLIGARSTGKIGEKVSKRLDWSPFHWKNWRKGITIGLIGARPTGKIGEKVSNRLDWSPFHWENWRTGVQKA
ncbi:hypothetical protein QNH39_12510 [Neobacillus novalis]|uniref:Uncharacterized protein n=1 Tax=Neobacillus novalis TaxID=220687 RepID=A0AA95MRG8_9BACI|nr:hypothetical protein [Neobacillus novalis]WHY88606.1 hypothetical protein QNH39_12510 [Neobacillus novalis]